MPTSSAGRLPRPITKQKQEIEMNASGPNYFMLRLALLMAPFAIVDRANAACAPASPVNNTTVTCSGATADENGTDGYGTSTDTGNTYNILSGASVTGTSAGLRFDLGTVNNFGAIAGAGVGGSFGGGGIFGSIGGVNNQGSISATGADSAGVNFNATGSVINSGSISGVRQGVRLQNGEVNNSSAGTIAGGTNGVEIVDVATVSNAGSISGGVRGISIGPANSTSNVEIANSGTVTGGANGIETLRKVDLTNSGTISGTAGNGIVSGSADITNTSTGTISGGANGIRTTAAATIDNAGSISGATFGVLAATVDVTNSGIISGIQAAIVGLGPGLQVIFGTSVFGTFIELLRRTYDSAIKRLATIDLFTSESLSIMRVFASANIIGDFIRLYDKIDTPKKAAPSAPTPDPGKPTPESVKGPSGFADSARSEDYFTIFNNNVSDLASLDPAVVNDITAFYTFLKASRDATGAIKLWTAPDYEMSEKKDDIVAIVFLCFLMSVHGQLALDRLITSEGNRKIADDIFAGVMLQCFSFLDHVVPKEDFRRPRINQRRARCECLRKLYSYDF
jgi:hypothetical protein